MVIIMSVSPAIVIGCHRSGTSIVTRLLERIGLYIGADLDTHYESNFFTRINTWLMRECGGAWDQPEPVRDAIADNNSRRALAHYVSGIVDSRFSASYLGWWRWLRYGGASDLPFHWGWKDPRNTITLPLWLNLFPDAKVIHLLRHGVDVADSLYRRQVTRRSEEELERRARNLKEELAWRFTDPLQAHPRLPGAHRCASLEDSFKLWKIYEATARQNVRGLGGRVITVRYEDLVSDPVCQLRELAQFVGLDVTDEKLEEVSGEVHRESVRAYKDDEDLRGFAEERRRHLQMFGYTV